MRKYAVLAASVVMQMALGGVYAWSTFVPALRDGHALSGAQAGLIFGTTIAAFTVTMLLAGRWLERVGPRRLAMAGGAFYGAGYLIAGHSSGEWPSLWLGIGLVSGIGIALGYVCPLTTCVLWFTERKGLVRGWAVAGFGGGASGMSKVAE